MLTPEPATLDDVLILEGGGGFRIDLPRAERLMAEGRLARLEVVESADEDGTLLRSVEIEFRDPLADLLPPPRARRRGSPR